MRTYAGIGARNTPALHLTIMKLWAMYAAACGMTCSTGACKGADQAFANGSIQGGGHTMLWLPWTSYEDAWIRSFGNKVSDSINVYVYNPKSDNAASESVHKYHPAPHKLKSSVFALHARNYLIIEGAEYIVCWTPNGEVVGGTGQALRIAADMGIPIYNLGVMDTFHAFRTKLVEEGYSELV